MKLKVCGLTNEKNIQEIIKNAHPDYLGFLFYPNSSRYVIGRLEPDDISNISGNIQKTGIFVNSPTNWVMKQAEKYNLSALQLHGEESPAYCEKLKSEGFEIIKVFKIKDEMDFLRMSSYLSVADSFLFDTAGKFRGGNGIKFNWNILKSYKHDMPYFLSGGIRPEDANPINTIQDPRLIGIDINSGFEIQPGIKDPAKVQSFKNKINNEQHGKAAIHRR